jgi:predicted Zn-dependent peptidase
MSSPLFQEVREKRGLVYSVGSAEIEGLDYGDFTLYAGATPAKVQDAITVSGQELRKLTAQIHDDDFTRAINQTLIGLSVFKEKPERMIGVLAEHFFNGGKLLDIDKERESYLAVTPEDVKNAARKLLEGKPTISLVGPVLDADYESLVAKSIE